MTSGDIYMLNRIFSTTGTLSGQLYFSLFLFTSWMVSSQVLFSPLFSFLSLSPLFSFHSLSPLFSFLSLSPLFISFFLFFLAPEFFLARSGVPKIYRISRPVSGSDGSWSTVTSCFENAISALGGVGGSRRRKNRDGQLWQAQVWDFLPNQ